MLSLLAAALAVQSPVLPPETAAAARKCAAAVPHLYSSNKLEGVVIVEYFLFRAVAADGGTSGNFIDQVAATTRSLDRDQVTADEAERVLYECVRRWPGVFEEGDVTLPDDSFDRDTMCLAALSLLHGAVRGMDDKELPAGTPDYDALGERYRARLTDARIAAHGGGDGFEPLLAEQLRASIEVGRLDQIVAACETALGD